MERVFAGGWGLGPGGVGWGAGIHLKAKLAIGSWPGENRREHRLCCSLGKLS